MKPTKTKENDPGPDMVSIDRKEAAEILQLLDMALKVNGMAALEAANRWREKLKVFNQNKN